jgi:hypothetical protein
MDSKGWPNAGRVALYFRRQRNRRVRAGLLLCIPSRVPKHLHHQPEVLHQAGNIKRQLVANGLSADSDLEVGQTLDIPNRVGTSSNNASTLNPYEPGKAVGGTSPNLPLPRGG